MPDPKCRLLTLEESLALVGCSRRTFYRLRDQLKVTPKYRGGELRYRESSVRWMKKHFGGKAKAKECAS